MQTGLPGSSVTYRCDVCKNCKVLRGCQCYPLSLEISLQTGEGASFFTPIRSQPS